MLRSQAFVTKKDKDKDKRLKRERERWGLKQSGDEKSKK